MSVPEQENAGRCGDSYNSGKRFQSRPEETAMMTDEVPEDVWGDLDLDPEVFRRLGYRVVDMITDYYQQIHDVPVFPRRTSGEVA